MQHHLGKATTFPALSFTKWFVAMAVPESQDLDQAVCLLHKVKDAVGAFEDGKLLHFRKQCMAEMTSRAGGVRVAQLPDDFRGKIMCVFSPRSGWPR